MRGRMASDVDAALAARDGGMAEGAAPGVDEGGDDDDDDEEDDDDDDDDDMDEDSANGSDADAGSHETDASDEYAWGDHVGSRNAFVYNDDDSLGDESDEGDGPRVGAEVRRDQQVVLQARRSILAILHVRR